MRRIGWIAAVMTIIPMLMAGCGDDKKAPDFKSLLAKPKAYIGSEACKYCHLEHYDSWRNTLHSRSMMNVMENQDALIARIDPALIRADLKKVEADLKVPLESVYIPAESEIKYVIGAQWKQMFLIEKNGKLFVSPIQYNAKSQTWVPYREEDWDKRPWATWCAGCHAMGVDLEKNTFAEPVVGCEACHGPGSHHAALPQTSVFEKRQTIVNPSHLPVGFRTEICGSCHTRGESTQVKGVQWAVGYQPGRALGLYFRGTSFASGDIKNVYANEFAKGHHQQYLDWNLSMHSREGVTCTSCHYVHQLGLPPTQFQTKGAGSQQCLQCHQIINRNLAHSIHSFGSCVGCHMPRIVQSAESGDTHSHVFMTLLPKDTMKNPNIPNSCQACHEHRNTDPETLQKALDSISQGTMIRAHQDNRTWRK